MSTSADLGIDLTDLDLFADGEPWPEMARLQREAPVHWNAERPPNHGFWSITRYHDVVAVTRDWRSYSSQVGATQIEEVDDEQLAARRNFLELDPPAHTAIRSLLAPEFTPKAVGRYTDMLRELAREVVDDALVDDEFDYVERIAAPLPIRVLGRIVGVPDEHADRLIELGDRMIANLDPEIATVTADSPESEAYRLMPFRSPDAEELCELGRRLYAERREAPRHDVVSLLGNARVDGCPIAQRELENDFVMLVVAGNETTRSAISLGTLALIRNPDQLALLKRDPSLMPTAIEEIVRYASPVYHFRRTATRDVELHGTTIRAGDKVVVWFAAANRDPEVFDDPHRFDVTRRPNRHCAFGLGGPHFCLGAHLARLEIRVLLEELLPRIDSIELTGEVARVRSNFANGVKRMPVRIARARGGASA